jgi:hypothetical protein
LYASVGLSIPPGRTIVYGTPLATSASSASFFQYSTPQNKLVADHGDMASELIFEARQLEVSIC